MAVALKTERRILLWRLKPRPLPAESNKGVSLDEIIKILEAEKAKDRARCYLVGSKLLLDPGADDVDEKNQIYIAAIKRDPANEVVTLLINRGDPNAVSPALLNAGENAVEYVEPEEEQTPGWSAHLVISTVLMAAQHRACFEKMPHVSSSLAIGAIDAILARAVNGDANYLYDKLERNPEGKRKKDFHLVKKPYRPMLAVERVPSENLERDLDKGTLSSVTLTKRKAAYTGPGPKELITRQEEKIVLHTAPADKSRIENLVSKITEWGKDKGFESVSLHIDNLPNGQTSTPTLKLDDEDALEQLYVRARVIKGFDELLEACYADICTEIEKKMIALLAPGQGW